MTAKETGFNIPSREEFHRHYGGEIFAEDFNTTYRQKYNPCYSPIALRLENDMAWDLIWRRIKEMKIERV